MSKFLKMTQRRKGRQGRRPKLTRLALERELDKCSKRIQRIAAMAYQIRQILADLGPEETNAIPDTGIEGQSGLRSADSGAGDAKLPDNPTVNQILAEQPGELSGN